MKTLLTILLVLLSSIFSHGQNFEWASLIDFSGSNEVAGMDINDVGEVYLSGVFSAAQSLPYTGSAYVIKADANGNSQWTKVISSQVNIGDVVCVGSDVIIAGQALGYLECNGAVFADLGIDDSSYYMFIMKVDSDGNVEWVHAYPDRHGVYSNLDEDGGVIALQCKGQFNTGDHIMYYDSDGNLTEDFSPDADIVIKEMAYYNGMTYVTGGTSFGQGFSIDGVTVTAPNNESLNFVLAFDDQFEAQWAHSGMTINSNDNQIVAGESGVYSYVSRLDDGFNFFSEVWHLSHDGQLLSSVIPPVFSNAVSLYPDLALSDCHLNMFVTNSFDFNSHELIMFDTDLNVVDEKEIVGNSNLYSGQVATFENEIYVSHVHTDDLDFNGEVQIVDFLDDAFQFPYLAHIDIDENCEGNEGECQLTNFFAEAHECLEGEFLIDFQFDYSLVSDSFLVTGNGQEYGTFGYGQPFYTVGPFPGYGEDYGLIIQDVGDDSCALNIEMPGVLCPVGDCLIDSIELFDFECETDSTYTMTINAEVIDPGNDFINVYINGEFYNFYEIEALPITVTGILANESNYDTIKICVNDNDLCCAFLEYMVPECINDGACLIENLEVFDIECETDFTFTITFDLDVINGPNDFIEVSVNQEYLGLLNVNDLPITLSGIEALPEDWQFITVCASGLNACCSVLDFETPDCIIDNVTELLSFVEIYPNPSSGLYYIVGNQNIRLEVYDSSGKLILEDEPNNGSIDLTRFSKGLYQVVIYTVQDEILRKALIKE